MMKVHNMNDSSKRSATSLYCLLHLETKSGNVSFFHDSTTFQISSNLTLILVLKSCHFEIERKTKLFRLFVALDESTFTLKIVSGNYFFIVSTDWIKSKLFAS
jgi:hypothetical protein